MGVNDGTQATSDELYLAIKAGLQAGSDWLSGPARDPGSSVATCLCLDRFHSW